MTSGLFPSTDLWPSEALWPSLAEVSVTSEFPPDEAALYVTNPDGSERRIAGDELTLPLADYTIASTLPGGFSTADGEALLPEHEIAAFQKFAAVSVKLDNRATIWEGRLESTPERSDDRTLRLSAVGHQALLTDRPDIVFLGVDSDMTGWQEPPGDYVEQVGGSDHSVNTRYTLSVSDHALTIKAASDGQVKKEAYGVAWYEPPFGQRIGRIEWVGSQLQGVDSAPLVLTSDDREDQSGGSSATPALDLSVEGLIGGSAASASIRDKFATDQTKTARVLRMHAISVFGDHGLKRHGINADIPEGLYLSDILEYLLATYAPLLQTTVDGQTTIQPSDYAMASAVWPDPTTLGQILEDGIVYEPNREWAVFDGPTFHYRDRGDFGRVFTVRRSEGARFVNLGATSEPDYNSVVVTFTDGDGANRRVGPPGSGSDLEDASLRDPDPENPVNASSVLGDRPLLVDLGDATTDQAVQIGQVALAEALRPRFAGEVELPRYVESEGRVMPSSAVRAGDRVVDGDATHREEMLLVEASYQRSSERPLTATVDTPANRLDAAIAKFGARPSRIPRHRIRRNIRRHNQRRRQHHRQHLHRHPRGEAGPSRGGSGGNI